MLVRLAFAVMIQVDADILLIDEVLAVGDAAFQQKCFDQFEALKHAGKTIVFVTHDMSSVEHFCDRAMLLDRGEMVALDAPGTVARRYNQLNFGGMVHAEAEGERAGDHVAAEITAAWFEDSGYRRQTAMPQGEFCIVCVEVKFHQDMQDPIFAWSLRNETGLAVMNSTTFHHNPRTGSFKAGQTVIARTGFALRIAGNRYTLSPSIAQRGSGADIVDVREDLVTLLVHSSTITGGVVDLEQSFTVDEAPS
jgi:ABC-type sulfate/molybdate transport systems ATPase subunit